jgi:hypothetical protein
MTPRVAVFTLLDALAALGWRTAADDYGSPGSELDLIEHGVVSAGSLDG